MYDSKTPNKKSARRIIAMVVLVCLIIFSVAAMVFTVEHEYHECSGSHCDICLQLHLFEQIRGNTWLAGAAFLMGAAALFPDEPTAPAPARASAKTLVSLSIQMNR